VMTSWSPGLFACRSNTRTPRNGADTNTQWSYSGYSCESFYCSASDQVTVLALRQGEIDPVYKSRVFARGAAALHQHREHWLSAVKGACQLTGAHPV
jgi:hypothetical protein